MKESHRASVALFHRLDRKRLARRLAGGAEQIAMKSRAQTALARARTLTDARVDFDAFLAKLGERDRQSFLRQQSIYEEKLGSHAARAWQRMASVLLTLAPHAVKIGPQQTLQFYIADGKYRKQVFALQALPDGGLAIYAENVLAQAVEAGLLLKPRHADEPRGYRIRASSAETLTIDELDRQTPNPAAFFKDMTGWNRKAICITLPARPSPPQTEAAESLCALSALDWLDAIAARPAQTAANN